MLFINRYKNYMYPAFLNPDITGQILRWITRFSGYLFTTENTTVSLID